MPFGCMTPNLSGMGRRVAIDVGHWSDGLGIDTEVWRVKQPLVVSREAAIRTRRKDPARHTRNNRRTLEVALQSRVIRVQNACAACQCQCYDVRVVGLH